MDSQSKYHKTTQELQSEQVLLQLAKDDPKKFEYFYNAYHEQIFRFVYQRMDDKDTAFDITAQVFYNALVNLKKFEFKGVPFVSWLYRIALNELNMLFRANRAQRTINVDLYDLRNIVDDMHHERYEEYYDKLINAVSELHPDDVLIVEMRYFEKKSFKEIGDILQITENNAKVKLYRIVDKLKEIIKH